MATTCPYARWDPLGKQTEPRMRAHDVVCLHTMAGTFLGTSAMFHKNGYGGTESHFGIAGSGAAAQWQDLDFQADANLDGNPRVISIETADMGENFPEWSGSDVPAWTEKQLDTIVKIVRWLCDRYDIPKKLIPDTKAGRRGIAYHRQGIDPWRVSSSERWSGADGKACPGDRRIHQLVTIVVPRVQEDDDMSAEIVAEGVELALRAAGSGRPAGRARDDAKTLLQGAMLDGIRKATAAHPDRGAIRGELKDLVAEVVEEVLLDFFTVHGLLPPKQ